MCKFIKFWLGLNFYALTAAIIINPLMFEMCEKKPYPFELGIIFYNGTNNHRYIYMDANMTLKESIGRNSIAIVDMNFSTNEGKDFSHLVTLKKKDICAFLHQYMGEVWHDITTSLALPRGICPLPPGRYNLRHHKLDFNRLSFVALPNGLIKQSLKFKTNINGREYACLKSLIRVSAQ